MAPLALPVISASSAVAVRVGGVAFCTQRHRYASTSPARAALRKQLKDTKFLTPDYADKTKINIAGLLWKWKR
ncbi:hypothetical protein N657DRAFT_685122 [Parathielavia appendiculata]|uniref:Uncharacterized protein n=1 Tax=Parathielavia appendiculata TaxID=2587402 RepID=A0AAN6TQ33_9PEZI|nr:hypothetical protein N657DRAFT_685122 [Parathielavia appendiculata]